MKKIERFCHQCQAYSPAPKRFKFKLQDDLDFNYEIIVDIMYLLDREPVLHVVYAATAFQNATFLKNISADTV
jgi:hypothetical protein